MIKFVSALAAILVAAWLAWPSGETQPGGQSQPLAHQNLPAAAQRTTVNTRACSSGISAFCQGNPPPSQLALRSPQLEARRTTMRKLGIVTPNIYDEMGLLQLQELSKKHDIYAVLQLAIRHRIEIDSLRREPGYNFKEQPKEVEQRYWIEAVTVGHAHSASILAEQLWRDGKAAEAVSWSLLAKQMGDPAAENWLKEKQAILDPNDRAVAANRAVGLLNYVIQQQIEMRSTQ